MTTGVEEFSEQELARLMNILRLAAQLVSDHPSVERQNQAAAQRLFEIRRRRSQHLHAELLGEPGWDMLLMLYANRESGKPLIAKDLALGSEMPGTTALRWQTALEQHGLIERTSRPTDGRVTEIRLTDIGAAVLDGYFDALRKLSLI